MLDMILLGEEGAREPVRELGLGEDVDLSTYFPASAGELKAAEAVQISLDSLGQFCETRAAPVFALVQGVDLAPLCKIGEVPGLVLDIKAKAADRMDRVRRSLASVQKTLDPFRGS